MLNTATSTMIDSTTNMATRSTASASNSDAFICRQSVTIARPATLPASGSNMAETRSEEHTSELQSLMRLSYAVFCLKKKKIQQQITRLHADNHSLGIKTIYIKSLTIYK